jgi:WD40 repeat protein
MPIIRSDKCHQLLAALVLLLVPVLMANPASGQQQTILQIETGVHEAAVNHMARLADGSVITVSDDKTARIWSPDGLESRGVLLPPIGAGDTGALYAVAASAKAIALGGRMRDQSGSYAVALYTQVPLGVAGLIAALPTPVTALCFSPTGKALAIGLQGGGLRVVTLGDRQVVLQDEHYDHAVTGLSFDPRGRLLATADDGTLRVYDADLKRVTPVALPRGARGYSVAVSPDGRLIAVGDRQRAVVHLVDAERLRPDRDLEGAPRRAGSLLAVAFALDGQTLFAGGSYVDEVGTLYVRRWNLPKGVASDLPAARDLISDMLTLPDGLLFATAEPSVGKLGVDGNVAVTVRSRHLDFRSAGRGGFQLSADGARLRLPIDIAAGAAAPMPTQEAIVFDVRARLIETAPPRGQWEGSPGGSASAAALAPPYAAAAGLGITEWQNSRSARLNGQLIALQDAEMVRSAAVQSSGEGAAVGTDFFVRFVTRQGERWRQPTGAPAWAVNVSADGRWVVAGLADGTVRWYRTQDGRLALSLFVDPPTGRFVLWTPEGFFDHDHRSDGQPDGRSLIGFRFNQPNGRASVLVTIGQLYPRFFRPDLVGLAFRGDAEALRTIADQASLAGTTDTALSEGLPPTVTLLEACELANDPPTAGCAGQTPIIPGGLNTITNGMVRLRYRLTDPTGRVGSVVLSRNDAVASAETLIDRTDDALRIEQATLPVGYGLTVLGLTPVSNSGAVEGAGSQRVTLALNRLLDMRGTAAPGRTSGIQQAITDRPHTTLFVLSVGVQETGNPKWTLANPVNDAIAVADRMREPVNSLYDNTDIVSLVDPHSTVGKILTELRRIAAHSTPDDIVLIFFAGHGRLVDGKYYFAPYDLGRGDPRLMQRLRRAYDPSVSEAEYNAAADALFRTEGLGQEQLLAAIQNIHATRIALIMDTCYSARLADQEMVLTRDTNDTVTNRIGHASGRFILSGSFADAYDFAGTPRAADERDHGLFTSFILRGLNGEADFDHTGRIDIYKLATFTKRHVAEESANWRDVRVQEPAYYFAGNNFFALR